jgi:O-antigen/teichoic acid export membrane protein
VIGLLIGAKEITYYSIGLMLVDYSRNLISHVGRVMAPETQKAAGRADLEALRWLMVRTTRATMLVAVLLLVGLVILGPEFITLWMGPAYKDSAVVLIILSLAQFGSAANGVCGTILLGLGHVKPWACMAAAEAILNLGLSVGFVIFLNWGIFGIALGSLLPAVAINNILLMVYTCKVTQTSVSWFLRATVLRWGLAAVLTAVLSLMVSWLIPTSGWWTFFGKVALVCVFYVPIGLFLVMARDESAGILRAIGLMRKESVRMVEQGGQHG